MADLIGTGTDLAGLVALAGQGKIRLRSRSCPLGAAGAAIEDLRHGQIHGRAILTPGGAAPRRPASVRARRNHDRTT